ncbi:MAG: hypothetical protein E6004_06670 [Haemophilus parainfluenzae]|nr:hypothetical protein [Haemophilus parainfluenzae]
MEKGILGPHEGKELELMLRGEKQVALFNQELGASFKNSATSC